ncbi:MAG: hypothetical protein NZ693_01465 [Thermoflexales bacterium]|nr:hypothetical protein [Thermoflexales bacterium]
MAAPQGSSAPEWAQALGSGFHTFIALVKAYFARRHIAIDLDAREGLVRPQNDDLTRTSVFGLQNIAQVCARSERSRWPELIEAHFNCIFDATGDDNALEVNVDHFERIARLLRVRLYPVDMLSQTAETVHRLGPDGTLEVLVLDLPTTVRTIARSEAARWNLSQAELFEVGRRNLRASHALHQRRMRVHPGVELRAFASDPYYTASYVLFPELWLPRRAPHGALVAIPRRDALLVHPIRDIGVLDAIEVMLRFTLHLHADGPGSLVPYLYWYCEGEFVLLPYQVEDDIAQLEPPEAFEQLLDSLKVAASLS